MKDKDFASICYEIRKLVDPDDILLTKNDETMIRIKNEESILFLIDCLQAKYRDQIKISVFDAGMQKNIHISKNE